MGDELSLRGYSTMSTDARCCVRSATIGQSDRVLALAREFPFVRPRDFESIGVPREDLLRLHRAGQLERVGRGLYRLPNSPVTEYHNFAQIARRVAQGVICLLSDLVFHNIGTQNPFEVWIAEVPRGTRHPKLDDAPPLREGFGRLEWMARSITERTLYVCVNFQWCLVKETARPKAR